MKQHLSNMATTRKRTVRDTFFEGLDYITLVSRFITGTEVPQEQKKSQLRMTKEVQFQNIPGSDIIDMSRWRTTAPREFCFDRLICNKNSINAAVDNSLTQSSATQTTEALQHLCSEMLVNLFQKFIGQSQSKLPEFQKDAQKETAIASVPAVDAWMANVIQLFIDIKICHGYLQRLLAAQYSTSLLEETDQFLGVLTSFVGIWEPGKLNTGTVEEMKCTKLETNRKATSNIRAPSADCKYIAVKYAWLESFLCSELGAVPHFYIANIFKKLK